MTKLKIYYQELLTSAESVTPLFIKKEVTVDVDIPNVTTPIASFIALTHKNGFMFVGVDKPILFHNILHVEIVPTTTQA